MKYEVRDYAGRLLGVYNYFGGGPVPNSMKVMPRPKGLVSYDETFSPVSPVIHTIPLSEGRVRMFVNGASIEVPTLFMTAKKSHLREMRGFRPV